MYYKIESIDINDKNETNKLSKFLEKFNLKYEDIDYSIVIKDDDKIVATCSKKGKVLKCFGIDEQYQGLGITNTLISNITKKLFEENIYHNFIFTKIDNIHLFEAIGYKTIIKTDKVALLEVGNKNIKTTLKNLVKKYNIDTSKEHTSLIMNCNPFTLGHRYLIEKASRENENILVFLVQEDKSKFPFKDRYNIVKTAVSDLKNVVVLESSEYIISSATFPSYFLKKEDDLLKIYTTLDCSIYVNYFCEIFNITSRYVGSEPMCKVTNTYNNTLSEVLTKHKIDLKVVPRIEINEEAVSASKVRALLKEGKLDKVANIVPKETMNYLLSKQGEYVTNEIKYDR